MRKLILAIDPGVSGAAAVLDSDGGFIALRDLPIVRDGKLVWIDSEFSAWMREAVTTTGPTALEMRVYVERVTAQSGFGTANAFRFGTVLGSILALVQSRYLPIELVTAATWKRDLKLGTDKAASIFRARRLFPTVALERAKDHNRAEALLLAYWAWKFGSRRA